MGGLPMSWWAIAAAGCRGQYGHGAPVPVGAVGAAARIVACDPSEEGVCRFNQGGLRFGHRQCGPRGGKARPFMGGREQTIVPDALEARGEHMAHEAPDELADGQCHGTSVPGALVSHPDLYLIVLAAEDAFVRDGDTVGVTRQVVQHLGWPTGGWLGIDHPVVGQQGLAACPPGRGRGLGIVGNCPVLSGLIQCIEKLAPEQARGGLDRKQEAPTASWCAPPSLFIEPAAGDEGVHMQVSAQILRPGMQHQAEGWRCAKPARVGRQFEQGGGGTAKQGVKEPARVTGRKGVERVGQREHPVRVGGGEQLAQACAAPRLLGPGLALRAMPVSAGTIDVAFGTAAIAAFAHAAKGGGSAIDNGTPDAPLSGRQGMAVPVRRALLAQDARQRRSLHGCQPQSRRSRSSGLSCCSAPPGRARCR